MRSIGYGEVPVWGSCSDPLTDPRSNPSPAEVGFPISASLKVPNWASHGFGGEGRTPSALREHHQVDFT